LAEVIFVWACGGCEAGGGACPEGISGGGGGG